jgi:hypothetical protein
MRQLTRYQYLTCTDARAQLALRTHWFVAERGRLGSFGGGAFFMPCLSARKLTLHHTSSSHHTPACAAAVARA